jgi:hypothetical protein
MKPLLPCALCVLTTVVDAGAQEAPRTIDMARSSALRSDVPFRQKINKLSKLIRSLDAHDGTSVEWEIKKYETLQA